MFCLFFLSRQKSLENFRSDLKLKNEVIRQLIIQSNATIFLLNKELVFFIPRRQVCTTLGLTLYTVLANQNELTNETFQTREDFLVHQQILRKKLKINVVTIKVNFSPNHIVQRQYVVLALEKNINSLYFLENGIME